MTVSGSTCASCSSHVQSAEKPELAATKVGMLKKALEAQKDEASQLLKALDPKGQQLDVRA